MAANDLELIKLVDQRVRVAQIKDRAVGTVAQRDTTGPNAQVIFDGSQVAMPVKVLGHVFCGTGDRVVLDRYGSDWVIVGAWAAFALGEATGTVIPSSPSGNLTSGSFVDITEFDPLPFTKAYDQTFVRLSLQAACFANVSGGTSVRWGVRVTPVDSSSPFTAQDFPCGYIYFNNTGMHMQSVGFTRLVSFSDGGPPAGNYLLSLRWLRWGGGGNLQFDSGDVFTLEADEGIRTLQPFL